MSGRRSTKTLLRFVLALITVGAAAIPACAQTEEFATAWEKQFPQPIEWSRQTSGGILIVRTQTTLAAVDGDGKQLWSIPYIQIGMGPDSWGEYGLVIEHVYEIPGIPILLIDRAKLSKDDSEHLLGVDLVSGAIAWQQPALSDPVQVFPLFQSNRVLLITKRADFPGRPQLILLDALTGHTEWTRRSLVGLPPGILQFWQWNDQGYLSNSWPLAPPALTRLDLSTGKTVWDFRESKFQNLPKEDELVVTFPAPQFAGGLVVFAAKDLVGLDPASGKAIWTVRDLGKIRSLLVDQGLVLGTGNDGAFAVDGATGAIEWRLQTHGHAIGSEYFKEQNALAFCDQTDFVTVDATTGKVIRRSPHHLDADPRYMIALGTKIILLEGDEKAVLLGVATGGSVGSLPRPDDGAGALSFLLSQMPFDLLEKLEEDRAKALANNGKGDISDPALLRLESLFAVDTLLLAKSGPTPNVHDYWLVHGDSGTVKKYTLSGTWPTVDSSRGLLYLVENGNTLRAVHLPAN